MFATLFIVCIGVAATSAASLCTNGNKELVGRVVFGEARGERFEGQLAVAWTIVNRVHNTAFNYPNTVSGVVNQKYDSNHEYNTLDVHSHTVDWNHAKSTHSQTYKDAISAATGALCGTMADPTGCATAYCARDPCSATSDTPYANAYNKVHIGNHYFVCQSPAGK